MQAVRPDVPGNLPLLRQVLTWAKICPPPTSVVVLDDSHCVQQAANLRPGFGMAGTANWRFQGFVCSLPCPLFAGGQAMLSLLVAQPVGMPFDPTAAFVLWQTLIDVTMRMGLPKAW